jgi:hypothetical protein
VRGLVEARRLRRQAGPHELVHLVLGRHGLAEAALEAVLEVRRAGGWWW